MARVLVVGGGAAGLSAGLFTAKNGLETVVFDTDRTWLHKAHLFNYPGIGSIDGSVFLQNLRDQVDSFGGERRQDVEVSAVESTPEGFEVAADDGDHDADYVVLATGADRGLAEDVGCAFTEDDVVDVNVDMETSIEGVYATGAMVRPEEWQAVISAGDGAAAALDILTKERGENFHDFDTPSVADDVFEALIDSE